MISELSATQHVPTPNSIPNLFERLAIAVGKKLLNGPVIGSLRLTLPSGRRLVIGADGAEPEAELRLNSYSLAGKSMRRGALGFAESYIEGDIDTPDLVSVFLFFIRNEELFSHASRGLFKVRGFDRLAHVLRRNSRSGSRRNIAEHYDLGNEFFAVWLDPALNYSSAYYGNGAQSLEEAQADKLDFALRIAGVKAGDEVLEIGCGWGAMARRIASSGANVTGITLSRRQLEHASREAKNSSLPGRRRFELKDYRDTTGQFDRIVSIEMIEAVGEDYWPAYFGKIRDLLRPGGVAAVQAITIDEARYDDYRRSTDFIQRYIFPGGILPTRSIIAKQARRAGLVPEVRRTFGHSYAMTLCEWRRRFESGWTRIAPLGFDERFRRMWRYYLAYCEAGFLHGSIDVGIYRFRRPGRA